MAADRDWVPSSPGTSLYIRPTVIASEPFLGVRPAKRYIFFVIASPVGAYHGEAFAPAKILVEDKYVRAAVGGLGGVKAGANYIASLRAAEDARARGFDQVLWTDAHDHSYLEEVGTMNMVARIGEEIVTPPLGGSILAGVTRDSVITLLARVGVHRQRAAAGDGGAAARAPERHAARDLRLRHGGGHHAGGDARLEGRGDRRQRRPAGRRGPPAARRDPGHSVRAGTRQARLDERGLSGRPRADLLSSASTTLPPLAPAIEAAGAAGLTVRRAAAAERGAVVDWVRTHGSPGWANECEAAFARQPIACFVAVEKKDHLAGVACYEATARGFFGPEIVHPISAARAWGRPCCCRRCTPCAPRGTATRSSAGRRRSTSTRGRSEPS